MIVFALRTVAISGSRQTDQPFRLDSPRARCIALFWANLPFGRASTTFACKSTGALGSDANTDRPPLDEAAAVDEGDDRFTSGARPTRLPTGASTQLQLFSGLKPESPSRCQPSPATLPSSQSQA